MRVMLKLIVGTVFITWALFSNHDAFSEPKNDCVKSWSEIADAWTSFAQKDSPSSRKRLLQVLPSKQRPLSPQCEGAQRAAEIVSSKFSAIKASLQKRDPESVLIAMRTKAVIFGPVLNAEASEALNELLGNSVIHSPRLFLEATKTESEEHTCPYASYTSEMQAEEEELPKRIKALETVKDSSLKEIRELCISSIKKALPPR
jgi:hypothetical protein